MRTRKILIGFAAVAVLAATGVFVGTQLGHRPSALAPPVASDYCTAQGDGFVTLGLDQMANAATITAVGIRRGVPEKAVVVALATAMQESKLRNLGGGDRDSVGLFQQRPSQGWGSAKQISDPTYAAGKFYGALLHVHGWATMSITEAAQAVQRSALPDAYAKWGPDSTVLAHALLGDESAAVACVMHGNPPKRGAVALGALSAYLQRDWGKRVREVAAPDPDALALAVSDNRIGWQYAHWLVANAQHNGIMRVRFGDQEWTAAGGSWAVAPSPAVPSPNSSPLTTSPPVAAPATGSTVVAEVFATG